MRADFLESDAVVFVAKKLDSFDSVTGRGQLCFERHRRKPRVAFNHMTMPLEAVSAWEFPSVYPEPKSLPFALDFVDERTLRLRWRSRPGAFPEDASSCMLQGPVGKGERHWPMTITERGRVYRGPHATLTLEGDPWSLTLVDAAGKPILSTHGLVDGKNMISGRPVPFSFVRRAADLRQSFAASFRLSPGEKLFGCGESFSAFDKRGQSVFVCTQDAHGSQSDEMYKPVPFYMSSRGYGVFVHGSAPMVFDLGHSYADTQVLYTGDDGLDLFVFVGEPAQVLESYTALTGRSPMPPVWSFGLWMSRITYSSEEQTRGVAAKLREHAIPCDVIHLDTGWFETEWCCNYEFSPTRFADPRRMLQALREQGFRVCLWQLPYFSPNNPLFGEVVSRGLAVKGPGGELLSEDAILDFSNPDTEEWYERKLWPLLKLGVAAIKVDFGEAAPFDGIYASGKTGWYEHNLYPLRYNRAAYRALEKARGMGEALIWARSAWAGSQRYPLHWGGDAEASNGGMLGSLRAGLSFGLSGFSFWSHDIGGFFPVTPRELYARWLPFGMLCSHSRCHGLPPTEPWELDAEFVELFRKCTELRYRLLPYILGEASEASRRGHPLLRPLFFEFPRDPGSWHIDDQYLLGAQLLVAPMFEAASQRSVYLPPGEWVDVQSRQAHTGPGYLTLSPGEIPAVILARGGAALATIEPAPHTEALDWARLHVWCVGSADEARGAFFTPQRREPMPLIVTWVGGQPRLQSDPGEGSIHWSFERLGPG